MTRCDTSSIAAWLVDGARSASLAQDVLQELCDRLVACGIPLWRAAVLVRTLHPEGTGRRFLWRPDAGVAVGELSYERLKTMEYVKSPVSVVYATGAPMRRRLADPREAAGFEVLESLRAEGATDYLASPLHFTDGTVHVASWATRDPDGFTEEQIAGIEAVVAPLARVAEVGRCSAPRERSSTPTSAVMPANASSPARSGAATPKRFRPRSGSPTCAASRPWRTACRRKR
jgi:adenylate cyclase